ncbi:phosphopyruvate hydratase [Asanoa sp. NPDC050611]|uniref:phosphopyruvate hydratase n=1 Tax=Asanoa sp. NPDC050611 TaxID=3157098 RepID=UPI0033DFFB50
MTSTRITDVRAWEALDSRGRPTVACAVTLAGGGTGRAVVPSGASTGGHEAVELRDGGDRYQGKGVSRAVANVGAVLAPAVVGHDADDRPAVDAALEATDGDRLLGGVGANAVLAVSLAVTLAAADQAREPLWRRLGGPEPLLPLPMVNIVSGGAHAGGLLDLQDILVVPVGAGSFAEAIEWASRVRAATADALAQRGVGGPLVADEGGLAAALDDNEAALAVVTEGIARAGLDGRVALAVDVAANQLRDGAGYRLRREGRTLDPTAWVDLLDGWCARYPVVSVEDAVAEDDWTAWRAASARWCPTRQVLGDDLFATDGDRLRRGVEAGVANAVLVKPNQAGTVTRAERVVAQARAAGYATVVSARSGDTEDSWLADLAVGWRAGQIKVGSTTRSERTAKWNRLLEIEATAPDARFAGAATLGGRAMTAAG